MRAGLAAFGMLVLTLGLAHPGLAATSVFVHSEPGDSDFHGEQFAYTGADGQVNVFVDIYGSTYFTFAVPGFAHPNPTFALWLRLRPPSGSQGFAPGTYEFDASDATGAQIDFGRGYWGLAYRGRFVVHEVVYPYGPTQYPSVLSVDFEAVRTDDAHPVRGAVRYRAGDTTCASAPDGTPCDDHDPCTHDDACATSVCTGADATSATCDPGEPDACIAAGRCDPTTGACASGRRPYGSICDDGSRCTSDDRCDAYGACTGNPPPCARCETCDADTGGCVPSVAGTPCDDETACTTNDRCDGFGACASDAVTCPPCETCDPSAGCRVAPLESCPEAGTALLETTKSVVRWRLSNGPAFDSSALAVPIAGAGYALCAYTKDRAGDHLLLAATTGAGAGSCAETEPPCWHVVRRAGDLVVRHRGDAHGTGIRRLRLRLDDAGRTEALVEARTDDGSGVGPGSVALPLRLQLRGDGGPCLQARYSASGVQQHGTRRFRARSD
jgi:hypothetical protein